MDITLNPVEVRVIGSLIEKQISTPEYYPLSLNALTNACNQLTNRDPVVSYDEKIVVRALESLREKRLARMITGPDSRVPKYEQVFTEVFDLAVQEVAVICVLMLRGPQTIGEIRGRTGRLYNFESLSEVELTVQGLVEREPQPLIVKLARQPGTKEARVAHLLSGPVEDQPVAPRLEQATVEVNSENQRIAKLEEEVQALRQELMDLREQFIEFKKLLE
jgi:uncharacterized protein